MSLKQRTSLNTSLRLLTNFCDFKKSNMLRKLALLLSSGKTIQPSQLYPLKISHLPSLVQPFLSAPCSQFLSLCLSGRHHRQISLKVEFSLVFKQIICEVIDFGSCKITEMTSFSCSRQGLNSWSYPSFRACTDRGKVTIDNQTTAEALISAHWKPSR